ncbi:MAG TPA: hypothetical protein VIM14_15950 [Polyangia bacterium]
MEHRHCEKTLAARRVSLGLVVASALAACATGDELQPQVAVGPAPEATKPESVSVFGIFRNGRMSPEAWEDFGKVLSTPFSQGICKAAYDVVLTDAHPEMAAAIDDYAKENGVSDELLEKFAPLAKGDTILLIAIDGQAPKPAAPSAQKPTKPARDPSSPGQGSPTSSASDPTMGPGGGRGMGRGGGGMGRSGMGRGRSQSSPAQQTKPDKGSWELTAYFYSVRLRKSTRQVELKQQGQDIDADLKLFAAKLGTEIPGVPCRGWDSTAKIDSEAIRKLGDL